MDEGLDQWLWGVRLSHRRRKLNAIPDWALSHLSIRYGGGSLWQHLRDEKWVAALPTKGAADLVDLCHRGYCETCGIAAACHRFQPTTSMTDYAPGSLIAVVDDDPRILESLANLLESADYAVRLFASAAALLESPYLAEADCLISDIDMPVMDGLELLRVVPAVRPGLPVILITGYPEMLNRLPPMGQGHFRLFKKPFDGQELLAAVGDAVRNQHRPPPVSR
jgi:CheY-like chemotaxis protein